MTGAALLAFDELAERQETGVAIGSLQGQRLAAGRTDPADLYDLRVRRVFTAAIKLPESAMSEALRIANVATSARVDATEVRELLEQRITYVDPNGMWARRIKVAACRRCLMAIAAEEHNFAGAEAPDRLGELGIRWMAVVDELRRVTAA
jgi:hypothetical protein